MWGKEIEPVGITLGVLGYFTFEKLEIRNNLSRYFLQDGQWIELW